MPQPATADTDKRTDSTTRFNIPPLLRSGQIHCLILRLLLFHKMPVYQRFYNFDAVYLTSQLLHLTVHCELILNCLI